ncbi:transcription factor SPEECHLESS-like [Panicum miliaceum]|uniref:Transcription factor SPEECHLESS-like n=1 Tax=Panicum miliaceum TaxID=4540 RepID=A0A3L6QHE7_PANMI|nr:transcription factor SPEECHLESS-like [Panicum miliaceum]
MGDGAMCELLVDDHSELRHVSGAEDLFSILETWEECMNGGGGGGGGSAAAMPAYSQSSTGGSESAGAVAGARPTANGRRRAGDEEKGVGRGAPAQKKQKGSSTAAAAQDAAADEGAVKMSHIAVERNRRKQMNEHLAVLRSLMPCFYIKRGDQASIIGGVVDYIKELQQVLRSLEAKKHRKAYAEQVLSPRPAVSAASPRPFLKSTPPLSPRVAVPISPRTPTPGSPYKPSGGGGGAGSSRLPHPAAAAYMIPSPAMTPTTSSSSSSYAHDHQQQHYPTTQPYLPTLDSLVTELATQAAGGRPAAAGLALPDVRVEFAGPNLVLKTVSHRAPGQALKIIAALESLSLEILHVSVSTLDDTMVHSFTIKIGIECELSAEELVHEIQQTFL